LGSEHSWAEESGSEVAMVIELDPEGCLFVDHVFVKYLLVGLVSAVDGPDYKESLVDLDVVGMVVDDLDFE